MSRPSSEPTFPSRPELLIDQSLGRIAVPAFFRGEGFVVTTIVDMFGRADVPDAQWIREAG